MLFSSVIEQSSSTLLPLLKACTTVRSLNQVHTHIIRRGFEQDHFLIGQLVSLLKVFAPTNLSYPTNIFNRVINPNIYLWNIILKSHCQSGSLSDCFLVFSRMLRNSNFVVPDKYTFPSLIKACSNSLALMEGKIVHGVIVRYGIEGDLFVGSSLVDFYGKCGEIKCARNMFDEMPAKNEFSWTAMMVGYLKSGDLATAKGLFEEMPKKNEASWNVMIKGLVKFGDLNSARRMFDIMPSRNEISFTTLIDAYAKGCDMASARDLFNELPKKDLISWSALISGYVHNGRPEEALKVFGEMWAMNVKPDEFVLVSLMSACSQIGSMELAKWIESFMINNSFDLKRAHVASAFLDMTAKCGNMERAASIFETMHEKNLIAYSSMIQGLCIHGDGVQAVKMFDRMISEGIAPDGVAFTVILTACSRAGLVDDGCRFFELMVRDYFIVPSPDHYACMIDLLGKSGRIRDAYELMKSKPVETHASAWGALLVACRLHWDIELGEKVARKICELEPQSAGSYVLLSNLYAEADKWLDVIRLRDKMSEKGVTKIPGSSYVE